MWTNEWEILISKKIITEIIKLQKIKKVVKKLLPYVPIQRPAKPLISEPHKGKHNVSKYIIQFLV